MIHIDIEFPRPLLTLGVLGALAGMHLWAGTPPAAVGGTGDTAATVVREAEEDVRRLRMEQQVLARREDIMRIELEALEEEQHTADNPALNDELYEARARLVALIQDQRATEQEILTSLRQIWEAQGYAQQASRAERGGTIQLAWPVEPALGISAHFEDDAYEQRFGLPHHAIDIPVMQGTVVTAAADGTVVKVSDNGMGFNSLVIRHKGGFATLYGHVSGFLVEEGQVVSAGDPIALSGGRPGTKGAGRLTTGAHVHLELLKDGVHVDPEDYLPPIR